MMLNAGVLPLTHIDGTPITGVSGEFYNVYDYNLNSGDGMYFDEQLRRKRAVVVCKATCTEGYTHRQVISIEGQNYTLDGGALYLYDAVKSTVPNGNDKVVVPFANARNVGDNFKSYFVFDVLPDALAFGTFGYVVKGGALQFTAYNVHGVYNISVKIYV